MSEKLKDPSKAAHEIIEVLEDGDAIRNDGVKLTAANKNPWYVLATIYGEQDKGGSQSKRIRQQNQNFWNQWFGGGLRGDELANTTKRFRSRIGDETAEIPNWERQILFSNTFFPNGLDCDDFEFHNTVFFSNSVFEGGATFVVAKFNGFTSFEDVRFCREANFNAAIFGAFSIGGASFRNTYFGRGAYFHKAVFNESSDFCNVNFCKDVDFRSTEFKSTTRFTDADFLTAVPEFHAAKLYDDTVFSCGDADQGKWPPLRGHVTVEGEERKVMPAAEQKRAYNSLRLFMNKSLQLDEEQFFHRMEMRCKAVLAKWYHKPLYWLFAIFSDYGNSVWRPIAWGALSVVAAAVFMLWWQGVFAFTPQEAGMDWTFGLLADGDVWAKPREAFGWSISNALPFIGTGNRYYSGEFAAELAWPLRVVGGVQTLFGFVLLFLFGLGLRNRFRLR